MLVELPVELVRQIIELTARDALDDDLGWLATSLALVCRDVHRWILPIFYHTVLLYGAAETMIALDSFKPAPPMAHVKCFMLVATAKYSRQLHPEALASFSNVQTFAVDLISFRRLAEVKDFRPTRLIYWPTRWATVVPTVHDDQVFRHLTHFRFSAPPWHATSTIAIRLPPSLTHVFLDVTVTLYKATRSTVADRFIREYVLTLPRCERVVVRLYPASDSMGRPLFDEVIATLRSLRDPRIYLFNDPSKPLTGTPLWENARGMFKACATEMRTGVDVWESGFQLYAQAGDEE
ncbi:hypothetical protein EXIGLDRAFT_837430 [Exidia glandulosa HHB12029]|uniref:F-box domain-containing protein n=1 Tax=Exidia glandulosa HHB12029 TaxID=1314781 RepID=A0A165GSJ9_EXIGL|nr:hypothetical protein EXIGLDRAFT_837430 [Exidia glandulosa HHB12029]